MNSACVCFNCRIRFRISLYDKPRTCPHCGGGLYRIRMWQKAPRKNDIRGWRKLRGEIVGEIRKGAEYQYLSGISPLAYTESRKAWMNKR